MLKAYPRYICVLAALGFHWSKEIKGTDSKFYRTYGKVHLQCMSILENGCRWIKQVLFICINPYTWWLHCAIQQCLYLMVVMCPVEQWTLKAQIQDPPSNSLMFALPSETSFIIIYCFCNCLKRVSWRPLFVSPVLAWGFNLLVKVIKKAEGFLP